MKKIFSLLLVSSFLFAGCKKDKEDETETLPDNIKVTEVNESVTIENEFTLPATCRDIIFTISNDSKQVLNCELYCNTGEMLCDGTNKILTDNNGNVLVIDEGKTISGSSGAWQGIPDSRLSLNNFAGQGVKYIGLCSKTFPSGETELKYGWIKIELNGLGSNLKIYSKAQNSTKDNPIKAGQLE